LLAPNAPERLARLQKYVVDDQDDRPVRSSRKPSRVSSWWASFREMAKHVSLILVSVLAVLLISSRGVANSRFPSAQQLVIDPNNPNRLWQRATYGVLTTCNRGQTWHWICEDAMGYRSTDDPAIAVTAGGGLLVGALFNGLTVSRDNGCSFENDATIGSNRVSDVSVAKRDPTRALVLSSTRNDAGNYDNWVWQSRDSGRSWTKIGVLDPDSLSFTIDSAPSDPDTIYVTGTTYIISEDGGLTAQGMLYRTTNGGQTWQNVEIPDTDNETTAFLSAIDPDEPRKIYVRVRGANPAPGERVRSWLLYSDNAGDSWTNVFESDAELLGFALAPDGSEVFVGVGNSFDPLRLINIESFGIYSSRTDNFRFERVSEKPWHIGCLMFDRDDLWVCTSQFGTTDAIGFEIGRSRDRGRTIEKVMELRDPLPLQCACNSSTGKACPEPWNQPGGTCVKIGRCAQGGMPVEAGCGEPVDTCRMDPDAGGGSGGTGFAGSGGFGAGGAVTDASGGTNNADVDAGGGCGCRAEGGSLRALSLAVLLFGASIGLGAARRRQRRRER
jgi:hypothetical protein